MPKVSHEGFKNITSDLVMECQRISEGFKNRGNLIDFYGANLKYAILYYSLNWEQFFELRESLLRLDMPFYKMTKTERKQPKDRRHGLRKICIGGVHLYQDENFKYIEVSYFKHSLTRYHVRIEVHLGRDFNESRKTNVYMAQYQDTIKLSKFNYPLEALHDAFFSNSNKEVQDVSLDYNCYLISRLLRIAIQEMVSSILSLPNKYLYPAAFSYDSYYNESVLLENRKSGKYMSFKDQREEGVFILNPAPGELIEGAFLEIYIRDLRGEIENSIMLNPESSLGLPFFVGMNQRIEEDSICKVIKNPFMLQQSIRRKLEYDYLSEYIENTRDIYISDTGLKGLRTRLCGSCDYLRAMNECCLNHMSHFIQLEIAIGLSFAAIVVALIVR